MFEGVGRSNLGILMFKSFLRDVGTDEDVDRVIEMSKFAEDLKVFSRSEMVGLIAITNEVGNENFLGFGGS